MIKKIFDILAAAFVFFALLVYVAMKIAFCKSKINFEEKRLLVLDMAYTLETIRKRQLHESITCLDLGGYFKHVWSVHPLATVIQPANENETYGDPVSTVLAERHTIVEGKIGKYAWLKKLPALNFALNQWSTFLYLTRLIVNERICVVRAGQPYYPGLLGLALAKSNSLPLVIRIPANYDAIYKMTGKPAMPRLFRKRWVEKIIERITLPIADLVVTANQDNLNFAIANGARKELATIFRYGNLIHQSHIVHPDERPSANGVLSDLGLAGHRFAICIGRLEPVKMPDHVIMTIAELKKRGYKLKGLMIGDGSMKEALFKIVEDMGISEDIIFAGNSNQEWIARVLPHAAVVLSPITGRALTESALAGIPIVAYDIDWQSELIKTGETGELVEYKNWKAMADSVIKLLKNPLYAKLMGQNVRIAALEMMDPEKLNEHERNEYDKLFRRYS